MEKNDEKKKYESKKNYSRKWAKSNINVSLDREVVKQLKESLCGSQSIKSYIEDLIKSNIIKIED